MILRLVRRKFTENSTIGDLYIGSLWECFTLEDRVRSGPKVPGETAIPEGRYEIRLWKSPRFKRWVPLLIAVPGFSDIEMHAGNRSTDTAGCILVGQTEGEDWIGDSRIALNALVTKIGAMLAAEPVFIKISHFNGGRNARTA